MSNFNMLPSEMMLEVLTRLPVESVLESKLVCKLWRNLVQHPCFSRMHLNVADNNSSKLSIIIEYEQPLQELMNLSPGFMNGKLLGSINGLICLQSWSHGSACDAGPASIFNPITRECITLPDRKGNYWRAGFGYIQLTNEYKVIRILHNWIGPDFGFAQVYTVGDGNGWRNVREIDVKWKPIKSLTTYPGTFVNGALHWMHVDYASILAFDLINEKFSELPLPPCLTRNGTVPHIRLGVLGDVLSATTHYKDGNCSEIWLLKKNKDDADRSWSKLFSFGKDIVRMSFEFKKSGKILWYGTNGRIYIYDPKASSSANNTVIRFGATVSAAILHKNTFVSLKALGEKNTKTIEFSERASSSEVTGTSA